MRSIEGHGGSRPAGEFEALGAGEGRGRIARGGRLRFQQAALQQRGHAIECRIYAEDPWRNFMPVTGRIHRLRLPSGPGVRNDVGFYQGYEVPLHYDPMLAKLIAERTR